MAVEKLGQLMFTVDADTRPLEASLNRVDRVVAQRSRSVVSTFSGIERSTFKLQQSFASLSGVLDLAGERYQRIVIIGLRVVDTISSIGRAAADAATSIRTMDVAQKSMVAGAAVAAAEVAKPIASVVRGANGRFQSLKDTVPGVVRGAGGKFVSNSQAVVAAVQQEAEVATKAATARMEQLAKATANVGASGEVAARGVAKLAYGLKALLLNPVTIAFVAITAAIELYSYWSDRAAKADEDRKKRMEALRAETEKYHKSLNDVTAASQKIVAAGTRNEQLAVNLSSAELSGNQPRILRAQGDISKAALNDQIASVTAESKSLTDQLSRAQTTVNQLKLARRTGAATGEDVLFAQSQLSATRSQVAPALETNAEKVRLLRQQQFNVDQKVFSEALRGAFSTVSADLKNTFEKVGEVLGNTFEKKITTETATDELVRAKSGASGRFESALRAVSPFGKGAAAVFRFGSTSPEDQQVDLLDGIKEILTRMERNKAGLAA